MRNNHYNHNNGGVACAGGSLVEYQPRLLGSWVPGPRFESGWGVCDFFRFCQRFTSNFPFPFSFPSSSFPFPSPYDISFSLEKRVLRIYPINPNNIYVGRGCKSEHM